MTPLPGTSAIRRRGFAYRGLIVVLLVLSTVLVTAWMVLPSLSFSAQEVGPLLHVVERGEFLHEISDRGSVESANNVEIRCEVEAKSGGGTTILEIVPEGTSVEPGDVLVKLDSSALEKEQTNQQIICNNSQARVIQAQNVYDTAVIAKREYLEGTYKLNIQAIENEIIVAKEDLRRAVDYLKYSERLAAKGYVTALQLEADRFAVEKSQNELDTAEKKLEVLEQFTKEKELMQLDADIKTGDAKLKAEEASYQLDLEELARIESQIKKCIIRSPEPGQVVYANVTSYRGGKEVIIEEGELARERQVLIRLPDSKKMVVKATINEAKITRVKGGMPATIRLDAFPELELTGTVERVNEFPVPSAWFSSGVKEYETTITIHDSPPGLRPGLTAEAKIQLEYIPDALQVPAQAIFEHGAKYYYVVANGREFEAREVQIGSTNDKFVVIASGLDEDQEILLNSAAYRDEVDLPELPPENGVAGGPKRPRPSDSGAAAAKSGASPPSGSKKPAGSDMFASLDANGNGRLESNELPSQMQLHLGAIDTNSDGAVDRSELNAAMARFKNSGGGPGGAGPGGRGNKRPGGAP